jgi:transcriptional regulator with XRE-family HTH domain
MWMEVFMLVREMAWGIRLSAKRGKGLRAIAREVGVSRNTVRRYLRDGNAERYRPRPRRSGKLAAFDDYIAYPRCHRDANHDAYALHNPVSQIVSQCFFSLMLTDFFLRLFNGL